MLERGLRDGQDAIRVQVVVRCRPADYNATGLNGEGAQQEHWGSAPCRSFLDPVLVQESLLAPRPAENPSRATTANVFILPTLVQKGTLSKATD